MRAAGMGSITSAVSVTDRLPRKAFFGQLGTVDDSQVPGFGRPKLFTDDEILEVWYRQRGYEFDMSYAFSGNNGTNDDEFSGQFSSTVMLPANEVDIIVSGVEGLNPSFGALVTGNTKFVRDGITVFDGDTPYNVNFGFSTSATPHSTSVPYYYKPTTGTWLPNIYYYFDGGLGFDSNSASNIDVLVPSSGAFKQVTVAGGDYRGTPFSVSLLINTYLNVDSFSMSFAPNKWFEYRRSNGTEPIWDENTGAQLRPYATTVT